MRAGIPLSWILSCGLALLCLVGCKGEPSSSGADLGAVASANTDLIQSIDLTSFSDSKGGSAVDLAPNGTVLPLPTGDSAPFAPAPPSGKATYYVAPNGKDTDPGTMAKPFRTLQKAADLVAAGEIVEIAPGQYSPFTLEDKQATAQAPIDRKSVV